CATSRPETANRGRGTPTARPTLSARLQTSRCRSISWRRPRGPMRWGGWAITRCWRCSAGGGFGIVFRAFDDVLQRVVAIKVLAPALPATSPARTRFLREARAAAQVRHENVVQIYAVEEQPLPYLVMEFIPGQTLQQRLDRTGPLDTAEVVAIGRQLA